MTIFNKYVFSLVLAACTGNIILAFLRQDNLEIYFVVNVLSYLIVTLLYVFLNPRAKSALSAVTSILFGSFMVMAVIRIIKLISEG